MRVHAPPVTLVSLGLLIAACSGPEAPAPEAAAPAAADATETAACQLVMGWDPYEPYHYMDVGGEVHGLDVELVAAIAEEAGCQVSLARDSWANLLNQLRDGQVDLITGATLTPEREAFARFSRPYRNETFVLLMRAGEGGGEAAPGLKEMLDMGFKVGVTNQYLYGEEVESLQDNPDYSEAFINADSSDENVSKLLNLEIDGFIEDEYVAAAMMRRRGLEQDVETHPVHFVTGDVHLMFSRESVPEEVVARMDTSLQRLQGDGSVDAIKARYLN